jgi:glucose-1-phosphate cytidylyltransferase
MSDVTFDLSKNHMEVHQRYAEPWKVTLLDTGEATMTGGRLVRAREYLAKDDAFCLTYGDGVGNVDISASIAFHRKHGRLATMTATLPPGRFGALDIDGERVVSFKEKPKGDGGMINGGFFVLSPRVLDLLEGDHTVWEQEPLERLAREDQLRAWRHNGFWQPMDTLRDRNLLEQLWSSGRAPWKVWS